MAGVEVVFIDLGEDVADNLGVRRVRWRNRGVDCYVRELRPGERVIEVVLEKI